MRYAVRRGRALRPFLVGGLIPLLVLAPPLEAASTDAPACLEQVQESVPRNRNLVVFLRGGERLDGEYLGVSGSSLQVLDYDPRRARFSTRDIPAESIATIHYEERRVSPRPPVFGAVLLGVTGLVLGGVGDSINDTAGSSFTDQHRYALMLGAAGAFTGAFLGLAIANGSTKTTHRTFSCEVSTEP